MVVMWIRSSPVRRAALWLAGPFLVAAVFEPLFFSTLQDHGVLKRPESWVWAVIGVIVHALGSRWFDVVAATLVGFAAGLWVDVFLRRREAPIAVSPPGTSRADKVSDLEPAITPIELMLQFHGGPNVPTELRSENILHWYVIWNVDFNSFISNEEGRTERTFSVPRTWVLFMSFNKPTKFKQMTVRFSSSGELGFEVKMQTPFAAIIASNGDIPAGILELRSNH